MHTPNKEFGNLTHLSKYKLFFGFLLAFLLAAAFTTVQLTAMKKVHGVRAVLPFLSLLCTWAFFEVLKLRRGGRMKYFRAFREGMMMNAIAHLLFGLFITVFLLLRQPAWIEEYQMSPLAVGAAVALGGVFLSAIFSFILLPIVRRKLH